MPVFRVQMPDGRVARIQADTGDAAVAFAGAMGAPKPSAAPAPKPAGDPVEAAADYQNERARADKVLKTGRDADENGLLGGSLAAVSHAAGNALPVAQLVNAGLRAGGNEIWNQTYRAATGEKPVSSQAIWDANIDASAADEKAREAAHPVASLAGGLLGGLVGGAPAEGLTAIREAGAGVQAASKMAKPGLSAAQKVASGITAPIKGGGAVRATMATAKAIPIGGAVGAGSGFLSGSGGLDSRLESARQAGEGGAATAGLLQGVAAPLASALGDYVGPKLGQLADRFGFGADEAGGFTAASAPPKVGQLSAAGADSSPLPGQNARATAAGLKSTFLPEPAPVGPVVATPSEQRAAGQMAFRLAAKKGIESSNVDDRAAPYFGKDVTAAELIGPEGERQLAATVRRGGETGDNVRTAMLLRSQGAPQRIADDFAEQLGITPEFAAGDVESMVDRGRAAAGPLWDQIDNNPSGIWSNDLERLSSLPDVRTALANADSSERINQKGATGLTYGDVEVPHPGMDSPPPAPVAAADGPAPRAPATAPSQGPSLTQWLGQQGGTTDVGGDLAAQGVADAHVGKPFQPRAIKPQELGGQDLDNLRVAAWEHGFFPESPQEPPTMDQFKHALVEDAAGVRKRFGRAPDEAAAQRMAARDAHDEAIYRGADGGPEPSEDDYGQAPGPQFEPARMEAPTAASWDKVRKALSHMVERDETTNRVITSGPKGARNRDLATLAGHMRAALVDQVPGLDAALAKSGDYMAVQNAYERARGRLTNGSVRDFGKLWASLKSDGERLAGQSALAQDVMELWGRGQLKGGKFAVPGIKAKLDLAFPGKSQAFVDRMEAEARMAASGARMAPWGGSPTMGLAQAAAEQDAAPALSMKDWKRVGSKFASGKPVSGTLDALGTAGAHVFGRTRGMTEGTLNEYGRVLQMSPDEFRAFLEHWENLPAAVKKRFPLPVGLMAGGAAGQVTAGTN